MPSPFPRMAIVVTPEQHTLLMRLASLQGRSAASYVRHLVDLATPSLRALLTPLEAAQAEQDALDDGFQYALEQALQEADDDLEAQLEFFDPLGIDDALHGPAAGAQSQSGREEHSDSAPAASPATPPSSNTGVRSSGPARKSRALKSVSGGRNG